MLAYDAFSGVSPLFLTCIFHNLSALNWQRLLDCLATEIQLLAL